MEPRESCCKERIQAKRFPDPAQNQKRPARNREVFITQRWLAPALLVALVCAETKPQVNRMRHKTHALFFLARLFNLMKTADYLAGWGHFLCTRMELDQASSNVAPPHTPAKFSLQLPNLPPILVRGFARRAFRLFAPTEFLQGFFELQERTKGGICARPEKF